MEPIRVILDTDIGDDVDDAFALALAARHPALDLTGVTACWGDTVRRGRLARRVLRACGAADVPVYAGARTSLTTGRVVRNSFDSGAGHVPEAETIESMPAVDYLVSKVTSEPDKYVLCAVGPLTNVAAAIRAHADFATSLRLLVVMGGLIDAADPRGEYNFKSDPAATEQVFGSRARLRIGPIDSTRLALVGPEHRRLLARTDTDLARLLGGMLEQYLRVEGRNETPMYDAVTLSTIYGCEFARFDKRRVRLESASGNLVDGSREAEVITEVDGAEFSDHMLKVILNGGEG